MAGPVARAAGPGSIVAPARLPYTLAMLKAIVFDLDGVLVDSEPLHYRAFLNVASRYGVGFDYATYLQRYIGYDDRDGFRTMFADSGPPPAGPRPRPSNAPEISDLCRQKATEFEAAVAGGIVAMPGALDLVERAHQQMPLAVATGATRGDALLLLRCLGIDSRFDPIVTADDVTHSKPHPETYRLAVSGLTDHRSQQKMTADQCLAIEDTAAGVESARAAGLKTLGVATTGPASQLSRAHRVVGSLEGLTTTQLHEWFD